MSYLFLSGDTLGITQSRGSLSSVLFLQDQVVVVLSSVVVGWKLSPLLFRTFGYVRKMWGISGQARRRTGSKTSRIVRARAEALVSLSRCQTEWKQS